MLTALLTIGQQARASVSRVFEVIDSPAGADRDAGRDRRCRPARAASSSTTSASATLPSEPVLRGLGCPCGRARPLALVGDPGSGKSTISLLLPRFYDVQRRRGAGRRPRRPRPRRIASLRPSIGLVLEESFLFSDTVRANIAYGRPDATDEQIRRRRPGCRGRRVHHARCRRATRPWSASRG